MRFDARDWRAGQDLILMREREGTPPSRIDGDADQHERDTDQHDTDVLSMRAISYVRALPLSQSHGAGRWPRQMGTGRAEHEPTADRELTAPNVNRARRM
jgi:hypothetical protein